MGFILVSALLTGLILKLVEIVTGLELDGTILYFIILIGVPSWIVIQSIKGGMEFKLEDNTLTIKKITGQVLTLRKDEIQKVEWSKNKFVFHRIGQPLVAFASDWAMTNILFYWIPEDLLPLEIRHFIKEAKDLAKKPTPTFEEPLGVSTRFGSVKLDNNGIESKTLFAKKLLPWNDIEVVEIKSKGHELKIWVNGRYTRVKLPSSLNKQELLRESFLTQVYTRGIPVCYSETKG
ncbi:MAG: hypothetical protein GY797_24825 [Deltaproteobacteria bacterium]|nr:hypothetical protein [Deltaproteobacteria bacterium]